MLLAASTTHLREMDYSLIKKSKVFEQTTAAMSFSVLSFLREVSSIICKLSKSRVTHSVSC